MSTQPLPRVHARLLHICTGGWKLGLAISWQGYARVRCHLPAGRHKNHQ